MQTQPVLNGIEIKMSGGHRAALPPLEPYLYRLVLHYAMLKSVYYNGKSILKKKQFEEDQSNFEELLEINKKIMYVIAVTIGNDQQKQLTQIAVEISNILELPNFANSITISSELIQVKKRKFFSTLTHRQQYSSFAPLKGILEKQRKEFSESVSRYLDPINLGKIESISSVSSKNFDAEEKKSREKGKEKEEVGLYEVSEKSCSSQPSAESKMAKALQHLSLRLDHMDYLFLKLSDEVTEEFFRVNADIFFHDIEADIKQVLENLSKKYNFIDSIQGIYKAFAELILSGSKNIADTILSEEDYEKLLRIAHSYMSQSNKEITPHVLRGIAAIKKIRPFYCLKLAQLWCLIDKHDTGIMEYFSDFFDDQRGIQSIYEGIAESTIGFESLDKYLKEVLEFLSSSDKTKSSEDYDFMKNFYVCFPKYFKLGMQFQMPLEEMIKFYKKFSNCVCERLMNIREADDFNGLSQEYSKIKEVLSSLEKILDQFNQRQHLVFIKIKIQSLADDLQKKIRDIPAKESSFFSEKLLPVIPALSNYLHSLLSQTSENELVNFAKNKEKIDEIFMEYKVNIAKLRKTKKRSSQQELIVQTDDLIMSIATRHAPIPNEGRNFGM